ncbi:hypothetical protein ZWY2020_000760 [Hordeum vulgare]|nr:hypothetical protein ZWY2020_000760 [Hordeum vulgare]
MSSIGRLRGVKEGNWCEGASYGVGMHGAAGGDVYAAAYALLVDLAGRWFGAMRLHVEGWNWAATCVRVPASAWRWSGAGANCRAGEQGVRTAAKNLNRSNWPGKWSIVLSNFSRDTGPPTS